MERILPGHGSGGKLTQELIKDLFLKHFDFEELKKLQDASYVFVDGLKLAITTDSYVVKPVFFPGGNIGKLSVCGTINDLAVSGAKPLFISAGFILEEGFSTSDLERIVESMANTAKEAGVRIVAGDTKVVEKGRGDGIYINTTGIGIVLKELSPNFAKEGDVVIVSGFVGDHGISVYLAREEFEMELNVESDCAFLSGMIEKILPFEGLRWMRDPTRGGLAGVLCEFSEVSGLGVEVYEEKVPVREEVKFVCEMLGFDPLYLANEGKVVVIASEKDADKILEVLREFPEGKDAEVIGRITSDFKGVQLVTKIGGRRRLEPLEEDPLPRIC